LRICTTSRAVATGTSPNAIVTPASTRLGAANLGYGAELGYISLPELLAAGAELDLHFTPRPLTQCGQECTANLVDA
jgi:hypothetical protein